jgi:hypothetical protein
MTYNQLLPSQSSNRLAKDQQLAAPINTVADKLYTLLKPAVVDLPATPLLLG